MHFPLQIIEDSWIQLQVTQVEMIIEDLYKKKYGLYVKTFSS
jgi:hypothetical protein